MYMVAIFVGLIIGRPEKWNIDKVPAHLQAPVLEALETLGFDGYGQPLPATPVV